MYRVRKTQLQVRETFSIESLNEFNKMTCQVTIMYGTLTFCCTMAPLIISHHIFVNVWRQRRRQCHDRPNISHWHIRHAGTEAHWGHGVFYFFSHFHYSPVQDTNSPRQDTNSPGRDTNSPGQDTNLPSPRQDTNLPGRDRLLTRPGEILIRPGKIQTRPGMILH